MRLQEGYLATARIAIVSRTTLTLALLVLALLAGCSTAMGPSSPTDSPDPASTPTNASTPATGTSPDEPPLDFDGADDTLDPNEPPHMVRLVNDGNATRNVTLTVARDGETVYVGTFRSFPNTTVLGEIDHVGNYTMTLSVTGGSNVTETLDAGSFDCNHSTTTFDLGGQPPTVETVSTEMACGTPGS
ncbi:hypothetical protein [Haloglomus litoreum]|uniref:hypothetical protein n=1 Tax=Haloglomus litoreum TaxID=3034026 RepID=UPI0023E8D3B2|nr:hypothetical protein [Haloglomus sp. DT116]